MFLFDRIHEEIRRFPIYILYIVFNTAPENLNAL